MNSYYLFEVISYEPLTNARIYTDYEGDPYIEKETETVHMIQLIGKIKTKVDLYDFVSRFTFNGKELYESLIRRSDKTAKEIQEGLRELGIRYDSTYSNYQLISAEEVEL